MTRPAWLALEQFRIWRIRFDWVEQAFRPASSSGHETCSGAKVGDFSAGTQDWRLIRGPEGPPYPDTKKTKLL